MMAAEEEEKLKKPVIAEEDKEKPNFGLSGSLAAETNTTASGTLLKYNEPPEAKKPVQKWRLYVFKGDKEIGEWFIPNTWHRRIERRIWWCNFFFFEQLIFSL